MVKSDIVTNFRSFTNNHTHTVVDKEAAANFSPGMDLNTGKPA